MKTNKSIQKKNLLKKSSGRSMMETLGVLIIMGLLTVLALNGLDKAMNKSKANKVLDDAAEVYSKMSMSKKTVTTWKEVIPSGKSRSGYTFQGQHKIQSGAVFVSYARVNNIPQKICQNLIEMQSTRMTVYSSSSLTTPLTTCAKQNDLVFTFNFTPSCSSNNDCHSKYGNDYSCQNSRCVRDTDEI